MRRVTLIWGFVLIVGIGAIYLPAFSKYLRFKHREADLEHEIERLKTQILELQRDEHLLKTNLTRIEEVVHEELGLVKPGEIVYKVVEEEVPEDKTDKE